jgi:hypothetical protein
MIRLLALALLVVPPFPPTRTCPSPSDYAAHPPQEVRRPQGAAYDPETLRVSYGLPGQLSVCLPGQVSNSTPCAVHRVYRPGAGQPVREPLVVFLPGSGMEPARHDFVLKTAAYAGYRTIGLSYDNTGTVEQQCPVPALPSPEQMADCLDCYGQVRDEIITGNDTRQTNLTVVKRSDSVVERLNNLLRALYADDLADGVDDDHWRDFYHPLNPLPPPGTVGSHPLESIRWPNIIVIGFSQGAGHMAKISRDAPVHGLVLLDGGHDTCNGTPPNWYSSPDASSARPRYGVTHRRGDPDWAVPPTWSALGFPSSFDDFEDLLVPLEPALVGLTDQTTPASPPPETPNQPCTEHSMAKDGCMPTTATSGVAATTPNTAYLFSKYLARFCRACDYATCP